jgi:hypothetical protein
VNIFDDPFFKTPKPKPPVHPFEVRISIGGNTWEDVANELRNMLHTAERNGPGGLNGFGGGWGGCHTVTTTVRDISADDYRKELEAWRLSQ